MGTKRKSSSLWQAKRFGIVKSDARVARRKRKEL
jgi:hypothetical protein